MSSHEVTIHKAQPWRVTCRARRPPRPMMAETVLPAAQSASLVTNNVTASPSYVAFAHQAQIVIVDVTGEVAPPYTHDLKHSPPVLAKAKSTCASC